MKCQRFSQTNIIIWDFIYVWILFLWVWVGDRFIRRLSRFLYIMFSFVELSCLGVDNVLFACPLDMDTNQDLIIKTFFLNVTKISFVVIFFPKRFYIFVLNMFHIILSILFLFLFLQSFIVFYYILLYSNKSTYIHKYPFHWNWIDTMGFTLLWIYDKVMTFSKIVIFTRP